MLKPALAALVVACLLSPAQARHRQASPCFLLDFACQQQASNPFSGAVSIRVRMHKVRRGTTPRPALAQESGSWARPRAWCGWWMRKYLGVADQAGNMARWWARFGSPAPGPEAGAIVVWHHHVGIITGGAPGRWIVKSGNDGHAVRERVRSVANAIAFRRPS